MKPYRETIEIGNFPTVPSCDAFCLHTWKFVDMCNVCIFGLLRDEKFDKFTFLRFQWGSPKTKTLVARTQGCESFHALRVIDYTNNLKLLTVIRRRWLLPIMQITSSLDYTLQIFSIGYLELPLSPTFIRVSSGLEIAGFNRILNFTTRYIRFCARFVPCSKKMPCHLGVLCNSKVLAKHGVCLISLYSPGAIGRTQTNQLFTAAAQFCQPHWGLSMQGAYVGACFGSLLRCCSCVQDLIMFTSFCT